MLINEKTTIKVYKAKECSIELMQLKGYTLIKELFVDSRGFGQDNEPTLTSFNFERQCIALCKEHGTLTAKITNAGQFQVYVGLFKKTGNATAKKIKGNTYKIDGIDYDAIRFHDTDILTFKADNVTLNSGGWLTKTTKDRLNEYLPSGVYIQQKDFKWYVIDSRDNTKKDFYDGMIIAS